MQWKLSWLLNFITSFCLSHVDNSLQFFLDCWKLPYTFVCLFFFTVFLKKKNYFWFKNWKSMKKKDWKSFLEKLLIIDHRLGWFLTRFRLWKWKSIDEIVLTKNWSKILFQFEFRKFFLKKSTKKINKWVPVRGAIFWNIDDSIRGNLFWKT